MWQENVRNIAFYTEVHKMSFWSTIGDTFQQTSTG